MNELFGGLSGDVREIDVVTGVGSGDCGVPFRAGEVYLVAGYAGKDGQVHTSICSFTRRIDAAGAALQILRQRRDGKRVPSLAGRIAQIDRNFKGSIGSHAPNRLPHALVRVKTGSGSYETHADADGLYAFYDLPPGRYEFDPELPPGTTLSWYIGSDRPLGIFNLSGRGCEERNIDVFAGGSIQGRVVDSSNRPVPDAFVYIVPAGEATLPRQRELYGEYQGKEGFFQFVHIPPGQYQIVVNPDDGRNPQFPYARTFSPGVRDRESAGILTVRSGEQIRAAEIRVGRSFVPRHVAVRVTWADGRLIRSFVHLSATGITDAKAMSDTRQPDPDASVFELSVLPDEEYGLEAEVICRYADARSEGPGATLKSNTIFLKPGDGRAEAALIVAATGCPAVRGKTLVNR